MTVTVHTGGEDQPVAALGGIDDLYEAHIRDAVRLAYLMTGDLATAQDLAQDAFLRAASRIGAMRATERFGGYLRQTVVREVLMRRRSEGRERKRMEGNAQLDRAADGFASAEQHLDLVAALSRLPARQRAVIVLRYWQDLPESEIARVLRCRPGTVKSSLSRGLATLRQQGDD
jgi:RNA polymerase sigma-70 factor (sigma-E family)